MKLVRFGVAGALIVIATGVITLAIRAADRADRHRRQLAAAQFAGVKVGMTPAQVRGALGRPDGTSGESDPYPRFLERCWIYYNGDRPQYEVCFQHDRVTRKQRIHF